ncbi:methyltransferase [Tissierella sp. MB52-C2]|uniref:methyltransferase n=1 Tax=Tissierella sp. MB52-C2 TaxID=3070999 RepID=UPI00280AF96E|nr:methyltransferase [Tissierella sp. MB52-C2]WMM26538.1 methyltransferase [Tissierella sp. MB52-C2]
MDKINQEIKGGFFDYISDIEYEIYSRYNYPISFDIGHTLSKICDFEDLNILDIGGNSGGLANAILMANPNCEVTVVDKSIPCNIGEEYKEFNDVSSIRFVKGDFFH